jgi:hypothetical protein
MRAGISVVKNWLFIGRDEEPVLRSKFEGAYAVFDFVVVEIEVTRAEDKLIACAASDASLRT